jgi:hypothetical protein
MASLTSTQLINQLAVCQMAALLLENGADVNARNIYGQVINCGFCLESFSQSKLSPPWDLVLDFGFCFAEKHARTHRWFGLGARASLKQDLFLFA